jgi:predicted permease
VTLVLLAGAGLLIRSFANVLRIDPGFNPRQLVTARVGLPPDYRRDNRGLQFPQKLLGQLREIPGVKSIGLATDTPFQARPYFSYGVTVRDYRAPAGAPSSASYNLGTTVSYLETLQVPLIEGRWFDETDGDGRRDKFVVDQDFARRYFPEGSAVGHHMAIGGAPARPEGWGEIIGVVGNVRYLGVEEETGMPFIYYPLKDVQMDGVSVFLRSDRSAGDLLAQVREKVKALDPGLAVFRAGPMESFSSPSFDERRAIMLLLCGFAAVSLFLAALGVYGVLACDVSQRTREIGIRSALGATRAQLTKLILQQGLWKAGVGLAIGIGGALLLSRFIASLLFDLEPTDPFSYGVGSILLLLVAWLASYLPARRAARINPIIALRSE